MAEEKKAIELDDEALDEVAGGVWKSDEDRKKAEKLMEELEQDRTKASMAASFYTQMKRSRNTFTYDMFKEYVDSL